MNFEIVTLEKVKHYHECCGDASTFFENDFSLIIKREDAQGTTGGQVFMPNRLLHGIIPTALLDQYQFWQSADNSLIGYMPSSKSTTVARSVLFVKLVNTSEPDYSGNGNSEAYALMSRVFIAEDQQKKADELEFNITPDPTKPVLFSVNLLKYYLNFVRTTKYMI